MIILLSTDVVQVVTSAAVTTDVHAYYDWNDSAPTSLLASVPGRQDTQIAAVATTDVVASPPAGQQRNVTGFSPPAQFDPDFGADVAGPSPPAPRTDGPSTASKIRSTRSRRPAPSRPRTRSC